VKAIATSAVRDARNRDEFAALVQDTTGLSLEVLSGKTEADWIFRGVTSDPSVSGEKLLVLGFGGGSTAAIVKDSGQIHARSFDLGAVRLTEMLRLGSVPKANEQERCQIYLSQIFTELIVPQLQSLLGPGTASFTLVVTGGASMSLAKMKMHSQNLSWTDEQIWWLSGEEVSQMARQLRCLSPGARRAVPGLSEGKHDAILPGVAILEAAMKHLGFTKVRVSSRGVRYGALLDSSAHAEFTPFDSLSGARIDAITLNRQFTTSA